MSDRQRSDRVAQVVELLATWGAGSDPAHAELYRAADDVEHEEGRSWIALLRRVRETLSGVLPVDVLAEIRSAEQGHSVPPPERQELLARITERLHRELGRRRQSARQEFDDWAAHLEAGRMRELLELWWTSAPDVAAAPATLLDQLHQLGQFEARFREQKNAFRASLEGRIRQAAATGVDRAPLDVARRALEQGRPADLAAARSQLGQSLDAHHRATDTKRMEGLRERLQALLGRLRQLPEDPNLELPDAAIRLVPALEAAASAAATAPVPAALEPWVESLDRMLSIDPGAVDATRRRRLQTVEVLQDRLTSLLERTGNSLDTGAADYEQRLQRASQRLEDTVITGGPEFALAYEQGLSLLLELSQAHTQRVGPAAEALRRSGQRLDAFAQKHAADLPTAQIVDLRLSLEQLDGVIAHGDLSAIAALQRRIDEQREQAQQVLAHLRKRRRSRDEAKQDSIKQDCQRLQPLASRRRRRQLQRVSRRLAKAHPDEIHGLADEVQRLRNSIERHCRLVAHSRLHALERWLEGRNDESPSDAARAVGQTAAELREALLDDELTAISEHGARAVEVLRRVSRLRRPALRWVVAALLAVAIAAAILGVRQWIQRPQDVSIHLTGIGTSAVRVQLVPDSGAPAHEQNVEAESVEFPSVPRGRYLVFVNDRFTGQVVRVPGATRIEAVVVPAGAQP